MGENLFIKIVIAHHRGGLGHPGSTGTLCTSLRCFFTLCPNSPQLFPIHSSCPNSPQLAVNNLTEIAKISFAYYCYVKHAWQTESVLVVFFYNDAPIEARRRYPTFSAIVVNVAKISFAYYGFLMGENFIKILIAIGTPRVNWDTRYKLQKLF